MKSKFAWILPGLIILAGDQLFKLLTDGVYKVLVPGVLALHSTKNSGAAMGLMAGNTALILICSLALLLAAFWMLKGMRLSGLAPLSLSLIAGGAIGNIIDRMCLGYVRDMFEVLFMDFYIFNLADVGVVCGTALCAASLIFRPQDWSRK